MRQTSNSLLLASACALALGLGAIALPDYAMAQISVSITLAPPALPVYEQPVLVEEGGIWAPGYWAYNQDGYFWVPGHLGAATRSRAALDTRVLGMGQRRLRLERRLLGRNGWILRRHRLRFRLFRTRLSGGHWQGQQFYYNTAVSHVNVTNIHNTYTQRIVNNITVNRVSFNGGTGGSGRDRLPRNRLPRARRTSRQRRFKFNIGRRR